MSNLINRLPLVNSDLLTLPASLPLPIKIAAGVGTLTLTSTIIYSKLRKRWLSRPKEPYELWNTGIFFPCLFPEEPDGSYAKLVKYLSSAERSLKICVMTLTYDPLIQKIIEMKEAGVKVQVITSYNCAHQWKTGEILGLKGVPIRSLRKSDYSTAMHHKFVIVDDVAILSGSLNWTEESITKQRENILVTTDARIVTKFVTQFTKLWIDADWDVDEKH